MPSKERFEDEVWSSLVDAFQRAAHAAAGEPLDVPWFPTVEQPEQSTDLVDLRPLQDALQAAETVVDRITVDVYEGKVRRSALRQAERRRDEAEQALIDAQNRNIENQHKHRHWLAREDLVKEAGRLSKITDPEERRRVLDEAGLRVVLYDEPITWQGNTYVWRWDWV